MYFPSRVLRAMEGKWITDQLVSSNKYLLLFSLYLVPHVLKLVEFSHLNLNLNLKTKCGGTSHICFLCPLPFPSLPHIRILN